MSCSEGLPPVSEEAFAILAQFYEYDRDLPLNGRVLYRDENEACKHEKFVIRGLHNSRIPGYLTIPTPGSPPYPCILIVHGAGDSEEVKTRTRVGRNKHRKRIDLSRFCSFGA